MNRHKTAYVWELCNRAYTNRWVNEWTNEQRKMQRNESLIQWMNESINIRLFEWMNPRLNGSINEQMKEHVFNIPSAVTMIVIWQFHHREQYHNDRDEKIHSNVKYILCSDWGAYYFFFSPSYSRHCIKSSQSPSWEKGSKRCDLWQKMRLLQRACLWFSTSRREVENHRPAHKRSPTVKDTRYKNIRTIWSKHGFI